MNIVLFSMAKKESKRLPNKNKLLLNNKPLYQWTFDLVKCFSFPYFVITDDEIISEEAIKQGFKIIPDDPVIQNTPNNDKAYTELVLKNIDADIYIMLPFTSPLRNSKSLARDINTFAVSRFYSAYCVYHDGLISRAKGAYFMLTREQLQSGRWRDKHSLCFPETIECNDIDTIEDLNACEALLKK